MHINASMLHIHCREGHKATVPLYIYLGIHVQGCNRFVQSRIANGTNRWAQETFSVVSSINRDIYSEIGVSERGI